jgi:uncharacterized protein (TIGR02300 family)
MAIDRDIPNRSSDKDCRMPNEEWGVKRLCPSCATRFYDLQQDPMTCPSCEATFSVDSLTNPKARQAIIAKAEQAEEPAETEAEDDVPVLDDEEEEDAEPNAGDDLLDDDDDDTVTLEEIADVPAEDTDN